MTEKKDEQKPERTIEQKRAGLAVALNELLDGHAADGFMVVGKTMRDPSMGPAYFFFTERLDAHEVLGLLKYAMIREEHHHISQEVKHGSLFGEEDDDE